jgi:hypothetical protein
MIMKKMIFALVTMLTLSLSASAMSYEQARNEALFLTDKMAYELNLTDAQYEAAYEINLDYLMGVTSVDDVFGIYWERRNLDLSYILYSWQWEAFRAASYFYRPLYWEAGYWHFGIYLRYPRRDYFYFGRPHFYATYRGGHAWHLHGSHSYYSSRSSHFRPNLPQGRQHVGMRNSFDRGDFRGVRGGSSTRVTGHQDNRGRSTFGRSQNENRNLNNRSGYTDRSNNHGTINERGTNSNNRSGINERSTYSNSHGNFGGSSSNRSNTGTVNSGSNNRSNTSTINGGNSNRYSSGSFGSGAPSRSFGSSSSSSVTTRSSSSSVTPRSGSRSIGSSSVAPRGGSRSSGSSPAARGGSRSSGGGSSHGHFGGGRR